MHLHDELSLVLAGQSAHLRVLRQRLDLQPERRDVQDQRPFTGYREGEDRGLRFQFAEA